MTEEHIVHGFKPVYDKNSKVLILGSMPSVKSREQGFYYGHPQNRFWKLIAEICNREVPKTVSEKRALLIDNRIAVWDVIKECDLVGSSDASLKNVVPADLSEIFDNSAVKVVFTNGSAASKIFEKYHKGKYSAAHFCLPSTSPANAAWNFERLLTEWSRIKAYL